MSPSSLANHRLSITANKSLLPAPTPAHRRALKYLRSRSLSRRARSSFLLLGALVLLWRLLGSSSISTPTSTTSATPPSPTPSLQFAPTQVTRPSARITYKSGSTQDITVQDEPQTLWHADVEGLEIPLGATVTLLGDEGEDRKVEELQAGDVCTGDVCEGVKRAKMKQDFRVGLRQLRDAESDSSLTLVVPTTHPWSREDDISLVTQFSISRLPRFERTLAAWGGPMSITIYLTDQEDIQVLERHLSLPETRRRWRKVAVTVVKPSYSAGAIVERLRYPINRLRNLALALAPTLYTLVIDADFLPSPHMHSKLQIHALPLFNSSSDSPTLQRTAVVISAFALSSSYPSIEPFPSTIAALSAALSSNPPLASLTDRNAGHGPSLPSLFLSSPLSHSLSSATYEICYEPQYEPYYLLHTPSHLLYDERFTDQGGDKQSHALLLNALGYRFVGLRGVWMMHPPRGKASPAREEVNDGDEGEEVKLATGASEDDIDESWPSARLAASDPSSSADASHFNAHAQKDERRYRYFQDCLPEMERQYGWNVRFPAGCGAGQAASGRMFGREKAGTLWGL